MIPSTLDEQNTTNVAPTPVTHGRCMCGYVEYVVRASPVATLHCHCADCRKVSGAPFVTWVFFPSDAFRWVSNAPRRVEINERTRLFCPHCCSFIGVQLSPRTGLVALTAGSLDQPQQLSPAYHAWTEDKLPWIQLADQLPAYVRAAGS